MNLFEIPNFPEKYGYLKSRVRTLTFQPKVAHTQSSLQTQRLELVDKLTIPPFPWNIAQRLETTPAWQTLEFNLNAMLNRCELK